MKWTNLNLLYPPDGDPAGVLVPEVAVDPLQDLDLPVHGVGELPAGHGGQGQLERVVEYSKHYLYLVGFFLFLFFNFRQFGLDH